MDDQAFEDQLMLHESRVQRHGVEHAENVLRELRPGDAEQIINEFRRRVGEILHADRGLVSTSHEAWYLPRTDHESPRWAYAKKHLGLTSEDVERTSVVADQIVARLSNPAGRAITTRGLVLGHVQSGKTTNFLAVSAKALDSGYDLVIILAGVHNSLRRQTQDRAVRTLVHQPELWWLGTAKGEFVSDGNSLQGHILGPGKRGLMVVKKHQRVLERLADWLETEADTFLKKLSVLVIDDEADQAGLNVAGDTLEGVHKQLQRVVNLQTKDGDRRCAYVAYTATPYANILTSQDDFGLYPRDFIYPLDRPPAYFGSQELFGDARVGRPVQIENDESSELLTAALKDAIRWFVLATSARAALGRPLDSFHSSMLIHTTQLTSEMALYRPAVEGFLVDLRDEFARDQSAMAEVYARVLAQVPSGPGGGEGRLDEPTAQWRDVAKHVDAVLGRLIDRAPSGEPYVEDGHLQHAHSGVIIDNSSVPWEERLTYSDLAAGQPSVTIIAIGGNTLSRGLTLEGLVCSYFARTSRTYDSLMQMARWFGYRPGYRHLIRIWTTQTLLNWFAELDQVEQELRAELVWMQEQGLTPDSYGPRIRVSPNMNITRAAVMRSPQRFISYSDTRVDLAWLEISDEGLAANQAAARRLAGSVGNDVEMINQSRLYRGVPLATVEEFLTTFLFHVEEKRIDIPSLKRYVAQEKARLQTWNVLFKGLSRSAASFDYGGSVGLLQSVERSKKAGYADAYIGSIVDSGDHRADVGGVSPPDGARYRATGEPPLLIVYAVNPDSQPQGKQNSDRIPLDARSAPISMAIAFPKSASQVEYIAPRVVVLETSDATADLGDLR